MEVDQRLSAATLFRIFIKTVHNQILCQHFRRGGVKR